MMSLEEGRKSWDLYVPFRITTKPPWIPPHCIGEVGRFGFAPRIHGAIKICFFNEGCGL